jgi:small ligand-binding sensory domain FIST
VVTFWGDLATGDRVRLGMGNEESLVARAGDLASLDAAAPPQAAVLYSCVGREQVLGDAAQREVAAVHRALDGVPLSGFFSFGEIGPTPAGGPAFYNHTAILVLLSETAPGAAPDATPDATPEVTP